MSFGVYVVVALFGLMFLAFSLLGLDARVK
jgi:hypothetical protein